MEVRDTAQMQAAVSRLRRMGAKNVIITGGHLPVPADLVVPFNGQPVIIEGERIAVPSTHGTGCAFSSSLACMLAKGKALPEAARGAKRFVERALRKAPPIGSGIGPVI
jgi:hydroxymethylpyrimidine kinase/phosphomethylpyrimidine kinase